MHVYSARDGPEECPQKNEQEQVCKGRGARQPPAAKDKNAEDGFQPGQRHGNNIYEIVGKNLIILNYFCEFSRMDYLVDACGYEYGSEEHTQAQK
jgi:hypothetical protein